MEITGRQRRQFKLRASRTDHQLALLGIEGQINVSAGRQFADDVEQGSSGRGHRAFFRDLRISVIDRFNIKVGRGETDGAICGFDENVREDWDRISAFHDILDMSKRIEKRATFNRQFHFIIPLPVFPVLPASDRPPYRTNQPAPIWERAAKVTNLQ